jgi:hypothetical protein
MLNCASCIKPYLALPGLKIPGSHCWHIANADVLLLTVVLQ